MNSRQCVSLLAIGVVLTATPALAHPGGHDHEPLGDAPAARIWTSVEEHAHVRGWFVSAGDGLVRIRRVDGTLTSMVIERLTADDQQWIANRLAEIERLNARPAAHFVAQNPAQPDVQRESRGEALPEIAQHFTPFAETLKLRSDDRYLYVESNGLPAHKMMIGITAWQQQVPLPQNYTGDNAWRIPLHPVPAERPMSAKSNFFRGAIALAVNGVPIFNPIKNDGKTDTFLAGELDEFGGHCGRADDYHYHLPPVHLEAAVGKGKPIAYALDGYAIYGYQDPKAEDYGELDWLNGHRGADGKYHYHATKDYPYLNGGFYGEVVERDGQVDPQPRAQGVRPALSGLRGATITGFDRSDDGRQFVVEYQYRGEKLAVRYNLGDGRSITFTFDDGSAGTSQETYRLAPAPRERPARKGAPPARPANAVPQRRPWIEVHAAEMDVDKDGILTRAEMLNEARRAFEAYDVDGDGRLMLRDLAVARPVRSAMGGFLREHAAELDRDANGEISRNEATGNAERMFDKADADGDGRIKIRPPEAD